MTTLPFSIIRQRLLLRWKVSVTQWAQKCQCINNFIYISNLRNTALFIIHVDLKQRNGMSQRCPLVVLQFPFIFLITWQYSVDREMIFKQESIPIWCTLSACQLYKLQWPPDVSADVMGGVFEWTSLNRSPVMATKCDKQEHRARGPCLMPRGQGWGVLMSDVQWGWSQGMACTVRSNAARGPPTPGGQNDRRNWKHYLPATVLPGGKNC